MILFGATFHTSDDAWPLAPGASWGVVPDVTMFWGERLREGKVRGGAEVDITQVDPGG